MPIWGLINVKVIGEKDKEMNKIEEAIDLLQHGIDDSFVQEGEIMQQAIDILSEPKTEPTELTELARRFLPPQEIFDEAELADVSERPGQLEIIAHKLCKEIDRLTAELKAKDEVLESIARISTIIEPVGMNRDSVTAVHNAQHREIQKQIEQELSI